MGHPVQLLNIASFIEATTLESNFLVGSKCCLEILLDTLKANLLLSRIGGLAALLNVRERLLVVLAQEFLLLFHFWGLLHLLLLLRHFGLGLHKGRRTQGRRRRQGVDGWFFRIGFGGRHGRHRRRQPLLDLARGRLLGGLSCSICDIFNNNIQ